MTLEEMREDAKVWFCCEYEDCLYMRTQDGGCVFSEPYGGECVVYENGTILAVIDGEIEND